MDTGRPVFDSGSDFEVITAQQLGGSFNASNDSNDGDDRSDDKGPEPEAVEIATINGNTNASIRFVNPVAASCPVESRTKCVR